MCFMKEQNRKNRAETAASFEIRKNKTKGSAPQKRSTVVTFLWYVCGRLIERGS